MGLRHHCAVFCAALAPAWLLASTVLAQEIPESVSIPLKTRGDSPFPNLITVSVAGGPAAHVTFDTGSAGLYILPEWAGTDYVDTGSTFIQSYEDHNLFTGPIVMTTVSFPEATGPATTGLMGVGLITFTGCETGFTCPGMGSDRAGVMGARYYNSQANDVFNPLAFLPGNLNSGFIVAATGPTPGIIVGLTSAMTEPFLSNEHTVFKPESAFGQGGAPFAWETKWIHVCYSVNGGGEKCDHTSFDTGEHDAQFMVGDDSHYEAHSNGVLKNGQTVTFRIPGILTTTVKTGDEAWVNQYKVVSSPIGSPPGFNSGAPFYNYWAVAFDYLTGTAGFSPITTWITGDYRAKTDSDLGNPGAIAVFGTLRLADGFISDRDIFIPADSTIAVEGDATLSGTFSGQSALIFRGGGTLRLTGQSAITGGVIVDGPTVIVDGALPSAVMLADGTIGGTGELGALFAYQGAVSPGRSIGTLGVSGDGVFESLSTYIAELGSRTGDLIRIGGSTAINGATLFVIPDRAGPPRIGTYTVLTSESDITGAFTLHAPHFGGSRSDFPFRNSGATTGTHAVIVDVTRSDVPFSLFATTANQSAVASAADKLPLSAPFLGPLASVDRWSVSSVLDAISGELYASAQTVLIEQAGYVRDAVLNRLQQPTEATRPDAPVYFWGQGYGGFGGNDGDANVGTVDSTIGGFLTGFDAKIASRWRGGLAAGASQSSFDLDSRLSFGRAETVDLAAYGSADLGPAGPGGLALRFGAAYSWHDLEANRGVVFAGFGDSLASTYDAETGQAFAELGYELVSTSTSRIEPFVGLGYADLDTDAVHERGGAAALHGRGESFSSAESVVGLRAATAHGIGGDSVLRLHGLVAWSHAFGDLVPVASFTFAGGTSPFTVTGVALAEDSLVLGGALELASRDLSRMSVSYVGEIAERVEAHAFQASLSLRF